MQERGREREREREREKEREGEGERERDRKSDTGFYGSSGCTGFRAEGCPTLDPLV
jgi:hypothetical protein